MTKAVSFFSEMRRRGMFGATAIYIVAAWVFVQVASETFPAFNIPEFAIRYVWIGVILLLPMAMISYSFQSESLTFMANSATGANSFSARSL